MRARDPQKGVVLINVLVVLALTATVLVAMTRLSDLGIARSQLFSEATQGTALLEAGEATAIVALRRDMRDAPQADHLKEAWNAVAQEETDIEGGSFALAVDDEQGRLNLNALAGAAGLQILDRLVRALKLPPEVTVRIAARIAQPVPLRSIGDLGVEAGLKPDEHDTIAPYLTLLPLRADLNMNTAPDLLLSALASNPVQARQLISARKRQGFLTDADLRGAAYVPVQGTGLTSNYYRVTVRARIGTTEQGWQALLQRRRVAGGLDEVAVIARFPLSDK